MNRSSQQLVFRAGEEEENPAERTLAQELNRGSHPSLPQVAVRLWESHGPSLMPSFFSLFKWEHPTLQTCCED